MILNILVIACPVVITALLVAWLAITGKDKFAPKTIITNKSKQAQPEHIDPRKYNMPTFDFPIVQNKEDLKIFNSGTDLREKAVDFKYHEYCPSVIIRSAK